VRFSSIKDSDGDESHSADEEGISIHLGFPEDRNRGTLEADSVDVGLVKEWIECCDAAHAGKYHSIQDPWASIDAPINIITIDVVRQCLVEISGHSRHVALSYTWGKAERPFQTITNIFSDLCRK
jgi:hypothetical protein